MNVPATTEPSTSSVFSSLFGTIYLPNSVSSYITQAAAAWKGGRNPSYQQTNCKIISWYWEGKRLQRHWRERLWNSNNCTEALGQLSGKKSNTYPGSKRVHNSLSRSFSLLGSIHSHLVFFTFFPSFCPHQFLTHNSGEKFGSRPRRNTLPPVKYVHQMQNPRKTPHMQMHKVHWAVYFISTE